MIRTLEHRITQAAAHAALAIESLLVLFPFALLIVASFTDNSWAMANGFTLFPKKFSLDAYRYIWAQSSLIGRAYAMTFAVTALGTAMSLLVTALFSYAVTHDEIPSMRALSLMAIFTMLFNGGLVATYHSYVNYFHVRNTIFGLLLPGLLMNAFNVILFRNYFRHSIPPSLIEAAYLDGAGELLVFGRIVIPLSKPILAAVGLMTGLSYWNDWQNGLYYLTERGGSQYFTIQLILNNINENVRALQQNAMALSGSSVQMPSTTIRMAIATVGILPILVIYPFFQQYFVKGITLGGVKE
jgi:putative aldouronate transport system permease protein